MMPDPERLLRAIGSLREHSRMSALLGEAEQDGLLALEKELTEQVKDLEAQEEAEVASAGISAERVSTFRSEVTEVWLQGFARALTRNHGAFLPVEGAPGPGHFGFNRLAPKKWFVPTESLTTRAIAMQLAEALSDRENTSWLAAIEQLQPKRFSSTDAVVEAVVDHVASSALDRGRCAIVVLDSWEILHGLLDSPGGKIAPDPRTIQAGTLNGIQIYSWGRSAGQGCLVADLSALIEWRHWPYPDAAREEDPGGFLQIEVSQLARGEAHQIAQENPSLGTVDEVLRMVRILIREQFEIEPHHDASYVYATVDGPPDDTGSASGEDS